MKKAVFLLAAALLFGCAKEPIDASKADKYKDMTVPEFVKERFYEEQGFILKGLGTVASTLSSISGEPQTSEKQERNIFDDGTVLYTAAFNGMNTDQLNRPILDFVSYCKAKGGTFKAIEPFDENIASSAIGAGIMRNIMSGRSTVARLTNQYGAAPDAYARANSLMAKDIIQAYRESGAFEGARLLEAYKFTFGIFSCTSKYKVAIIPVKYKTPSQNCIENGTSLDSTFCRVHTLKIAISPIPT